MILSIFFGVLIQILNGFFFLVSFGQKITAIPLVDSYLVSAFGFWNAFLAEFPPIQIVWTLTLWYISFEIALLIVKLFFGHRVTL